MLEGALRYRWVLGPTCLLVGLVVAGVEWALWRPESGALIQTLATLVGLAVAVLAWVIGPPLERLATSRGLGSAANIAWAVIGTCGLLLLAPSVGVSVFLSWPQESSQSPESHPRPADSLPLPSGIASPATGSPTAKKPTSSPTEGQSLPQA